MDVVYNNNNNLGYRTFIKISAHRQPTGYSPKARLFVSSFSIDRFSQPFLIVGHVLCNCFYRQSFSSLN